MNIAPSSSSPISIATSGDHFIRDGQPFFLCADTSWAAFTNATDEGWDEYLRVRGLQGFNALLLNILPQWDRSKKPHTPQPFELQPDGRCDFSRPRGAY